MEEIGLRSQEVKTDFKINVRDVKRKEEAEHRPGGILW